MIEHNLHISCKT